MEAVNSLNRQARGGYPRSIKIAGVEARSAEVGWAFKLLSGGGSHAAGMRSLG